MTTQPDDPDLTFKDLAVSVALVSLVGVLCNALYELLRTQAPALGIAAVAVTCIVIMRFVLSPMIRRWTAGFGRWRADVSEVYLNPDVPKSRALIAFVSAGDGWTSARDAAFFHLPVLEHLWLITSEEGRENYRTVRSQVEAEAERRAVKVTVHPIDVLKDVFDVELAKNRVAEIRHQALGMGIPEPEVICDFTGMTKQASVGMIFACARKDARLQYMRAKHYKPAGQPDYDAGSYPLRIEVSYILIPEK